MAEAKEQIGTDDPRSERLRQMYSSFLACWMRRGYSELQAVLLLYELVASDLERLAPPDHCAGSQARPISISLH